MGEVRSNPQHRINMMKYCGSFRTNLYLLLHLKNLIWFELSTFLVFV